MLLLAVLYPLGRAFARGSKCRKWIIKCVLGGRRGGDMRANCRDLGLIGILFGGVLDTPEGGAAYLGVRTGYELGTD